MADILPKYSLVYCLHACCREFAAKTLVTVVRATRSATPRLASAKPRNKRVKRSPRMVLLLQQYFYSPSTSTCPNMSSGDVICPDKSTCPSGQTCCVMFIGYGCCPAPEVGHSFPFLRYIYMYLPLPYFESCTAMTTCTCTLHVHV